LDKLSLVHSFELRLTVKGGDVLSTLEIFW